MVIRLPLLIDAHFHARDFNQQHKGTFETETKAVLLLGFHPRFTRLHLPGSRVHD